MKNKLKLTGYSIISAMATFPALVVAATNGFDPSAGGNTNLPSGSIMGIITQIMNWLLMAVGIIGVIGFAISGLLYLTAAGDDTKIKSAKGAMIASITGVIVAIAGVVALTAAKNMLGGSSSSF